MNRDLIAAFGMILRLYGGVKPNGLTYHRDQDGFEAVTVCVDGDTKTIDITDKKPTCIIRMIIDTVEEMSNG